MSEHRQKEVIKETIDANSYYGEVKIDWGAYADTAESNDETIGMATISLDLLKSVVDEAARDGGHGSAAEVYVSDDLPLVIKLEDGTEYAVAPRKK